MARTRIKFCGMCSAQDMSDAARAGADAVGFVFHAKSVRNVQAHDVARWLKDSPPLLNRVFLFMNPQADDVRRVLDQVRPDYLQFHGDESADFCAQFGLPWAKALPMGDPPKAQSMITECRGAAFFLADSHGGTNRSGGSGHGFDWDQIAGLPKKTMIAGGLAADNVGELIRLWQPWGVDVSSGIEDAPGQKSARKMEHFAAVVREADAKRMDTLNPTNQARDIRG